MKVRRLLAIWTAKLISTVCRLSGRQGVTLAGKVALRLDPDILKDLASQVRRKIFVVCGTNGKTTVNNLLCTALEAEGNRVVCNRTGSNMLQGAAAAFVLAAKNNGTLDADYAAIEVDEASTLRIFPHFKPDLMVLTNLFRDQLDRYGEIDTTMSMLERAMKMAPKMQVVVNGDDALSAYVAMESGNSYITYGISEPVKRGESLREVRDGQFCKHCGERLVYRFYHYSQLGDYHCPKCGFHRPAADFDASEIEMADGIAFTVTEHRPGAEEAQTAGQTDLAGAKEVQTAGQTDLAGAQAAAAREVQAPAAKKRILANYRGFYNVYNILAVYSAIRTAGIVPKQFDRVLKEFNPQNGRMETFMIDGRKAVLNLAKNPAGFNQNVLAVMEDPGEKDLMIVINDNAGDGIDVSWLWDVDFDRFADPGIRSIMVSGIRARDMQLRLKYVGIQANIEEDTASALQKALQNSCGTLYVLVNYTALFSTRKLLAGLQKSPEV